MTNTKYTTLSQTGVKFIIYFNSNKINNNIASRFHEPFSFTGPRYYVYVIGPASFYSLLKSGGRARVEFVCVKKRRSVYSLYYACPLHQAGSLAKRTHHRLYSRPTNAIPQYIINHHHEGPDCFPARLAGVAEQDQTDSHQTLYSTAVYLPGP